MLARIPGPLFAGLLLLQSSISKADLALQYLSHQKMLNPGERAAALGGAYTSLADDPSGIYYNPAGISFAVGKELSLNVLFSKLRNETVFKEVVNGEDFKEKSETQFAGLTGGLIRFGRLSLSYVLTTLDNRNINQNDNFNDVSNEENGLNEFDRIHQESVSYNLIGGGAALKIGDCWSLGLSVFRYARRIEWMDFQSVHYNNDRINILATKVNTENIGLLPIAGLTWRGKTAAFGVSGRKGIALRDSTEFAVQTLAYQSDANDGAPKTSSASKTSDFYDERNPVSLQIGASWFPNNHFLVTGDIARHSGVPAEGEKVGLETTYNYALGVELGISLLAVQMGVFTNNSMFPNPEGGGEETGHAVHLDYVGRSLGLTFKRRDVDGTIGYVFQSGQGKSRIISGDSSLQDVYGNSELTFAAVRYNF